MASNLGFEVQGSRLPLRLKIAQKPSIVWSLGSEALYYTSFEPEGSCMVGPGHSCRWHSATQRAIPPPKTCKETR